MTTYELRLWDDSDVDPKWVHIPHYSELKVGFAENSVQAIEFSYATGGLNYDALLDMMEGTATEAVVGFFVDGALIDDSLYILEESELDELSEDPTRVFRGRTLGHASLDYTIVAPASGATLAVDRTFTNRTAGYILKTFYDEAVARGACYGLELAFDAVNDSAGYAWSTVPLISRSYAVGTTLLQVLQDLIDNKHIWCWTRGWDLSSVAVEMATKLYAVHSTDVLLDKWVDRSSNNFNFMGFFKGRDLSDSTVKTQIRETARRVYVQGENNIFATRTSALPAGRAKREIYQSASGVKTTAQLGTIADTLLAAKELPVTDRTLGVQPSESEGSPIPLKNVFVGDIVSIDNGSAKENRRIIQATFTRSSSDDSPDFALVVGERIVTESMQYMRRARAVTGINRLSEATVTDDIVGATRTNKGVLINDRVMVGDTSLMSTTTEVHIAGSTTSLRLGVGAAGSVHVQSKDNISNYRPILASAFTVSSTEETKEDIAEHGYGLETLTKLRPVKFRRGQGPTQLGVIAEEVEVAVPEAAVYYAEDEEEMDGVVPGALFGVDLAALVSLLLGGLQEADTRIKALENEVNKTKPK